MPRNETGSRSKGVFGVKATIELAELPRAVLLAFCFVVYIPQPKNAINNVLRNRWTDKKLIITATFNGRQNEETSTSL